MIPFLLPLLALGAFALFASRRHVADETSIAVSRGGAPSPIVVLDGFLRAGEVPPPFVIQCAIAEAETSGRLDLADALVRAFVLPVVLAAEQGALEEARDANGYEPAALPASYASPTQGWPPGIRPPGGRPPTAQRPWWPHRAHASPPGSPPDHRGVPTPHQAHHVQPPAEHPRAPRVPHGEHAAMPQPPVPSPFGHASIADPAYTKVEILPRPDAGGRGDRRHEHGGRGSPNAGTLTVSGRSSPIDGIGTDEWAAFVGRVSRELPTFMTDRHVGSFRQRRDRLAELGIDPGSIVGSLDAQRAALDQDMLDAYRHASDSGLVAEYRGVCVEIPAPASGEIVPIEVTLSGVMGVIQAAGLEGAAQWLESPVDRRRFPHTTAAFLRTNGVF